MAHVQTKDAQASAATTLAVSLTGVGSGNELVASTVFDNATGNPTTTTSTPSATWSSAIASTAAVGGSSLWLRMDYSENVASGVWTVNHNASVAGFITGLVTELSGRATSASLGVTSVAGTVNVTTQAPGSITPASGSDLVSGTGDEGGETTADTIDSAFTIQSDLTAWNGANLRGGQATKENVAASAVNPTWTKPGAAVTMEAMIAEFTVAPAAAIPPPFPAAKLVVG